MRDLLSAQGSLTSEFGMESGVTFPLLPPAHLKTCDFAPIYPPPGVFFGQRTHRGVDLIDCSSGGLVHGAKFKTGPGFMVPFAQTIRKEAGIATGAVGFITDPQQAEEIISGGKADAVFLARQMLRDPYWPLHAAKALGADVPWPKQYERAK